MEKALLISFLENQLIHLNRTKKRIELKALFFEMEEEDIIEEEKDLEFSITDIKRLLKLLNEK